MILAIKTVRCNYLGPNTIGIYLQLLLGENYFWQKKGVDVFVSHKIFALFYIFLLIAEAVEAI